MLHRLLQSALCTKFKQAQKPNKTDQIKKKINSDHLCYRHVNESKWQTHVYFVCMHATRCIAGEKKKTIVTCHGTKYLSFEREDFNTWVDVLHMKNKTKTRSLLHQKKIYYDVKCTTTTYIIYIFYIFATIQSLLHFLKRLVIYRGLFRYRSWPTK